jgi:hypothetical protein
MAAPPNYTKKSVVNAAKKNKATPFKDIDRKLKVAPSQLNKTL